MSDDAGSVVKESARDAQHAARTVALLEDNIRDVGALFCLRASELQPIAEQLANLEAQLRAMRAMAGMGTDPRPCARELAVEVLHGKVTALCPYLPQVAAKSARRAERALTGSPQSTEAAPCDPEP